MADAVQVRNALEAVMDPELKRNLVDLGMVVRKAVKMVEQMKVPVLGVVGNMRYFACPDTGVCHEIFGPSRGEELVRAALAPLLAKLPLDPAIALSRPTIERGSVTDG